MKVKNIFLRLSLVLLMLLVTEKDIFAQALEVNVVGGRWVFTSDSRKHLFIAPMGSNGQWNWDLGTTLFSNGSLGIGTVTPNSSYKLMVNGTIRAKEIRVNTGWSDFVFEEDYSLPTLSEVESHIKEKKHLPGIPSAAEVETEGVELGVISSKLLQKVEELTLYVIAQEKQIAEQQARIEMLEKLLIDADSSKPSR